MTRRQGTRARWASRDIKIHGEYLIQRLQDIIGPFIEMLGQGALPDGGLTTQVYGAPVNYDDGSEALASIDPQLAAGPDGWQSEGSPVEVLVPEDLAEEPVELGAGGMALEVAAVAVSAIRLAIEKRSPNPLQNTPVTNQEKWL